MIALLASCSKAQDTDNLYTQEISFRIRFVAPNEIPERLRKKANIRPTHGTMTTDRVTIDFNIVDSSDRGFKTENITLAKGTYFVSDISLYNAIGEKVMYMKERKEDTSKGSEIVSWIGEDFIFDERSESGYVLRVFYS